jgi:hypothetical protein
MLVNIKIVEYSLPAHLLYKLYLLGVPLVPQTAPLPSELWRPPPPRLAIQPAVADAQAAPERLVCP